MEHCRRRGFVSFLLGSIIIMIWKWTGTSGRRQPRVNLDGGVGRLAGRWAWHVDMDQAEWTDALWKIHVLNK